MASQGAASGSAPGGGSGSGSGSGSGTNTRPKPTVAKGVANLGNTCYMNAVLQALAHAPDLCTAMEVESHRENCPTYRANMERREEKKKEEEKLKTETATKPEGVSGGGQSAAGPTAVGNGVVVKTEQPYGSATTENGNNTNGKGSSSASSKKGKNGGKRSKKGRSISPTPPSMVDPDFDEDDEFCLLCEVEKHMERVHPSNSSGNGAAGLTGKSSQQVPAAGLAAAAADDGSTSSVAPSTFVNGFIGHVAPWFKLGKQEDSHEFLRLLIDAMQKSCTKARKVSSAKVKAKDNDEVVKKEETEDACKKPEEKDKDAAVESEYPFQLFRGIVESNVQCGSCNATSSKLDPIEDVGLEVTFAHGHGQGKPPSGGQAALADVGASLKRFIEAEELDSGYKCDKCGKVGKATKTSRLASIPPILTLHLKRFRYGAFGDSSGAFNGGLAGTSSRRGRSTEAPHGASGSAKIEGHVPFKNIFNIGPYMTDGEKKSPYTMCRLFAVIVHAGKNSHSGHYIAYVKNVSQSSKDEWWKMDDAKVNQVTTAEVEAAEAYMLFYRVLRHPISKKLENAKEEKDAAAKSTAGDSNQFDAAKSDSSGSKSALGKRKLQVPDFVSGQEWSRAKTNLSLDMAPSLRVADELVGENIQLTADYFKLLVEEANNGGSSGPSGVSAEEDIQGGPERYRLPLLQYLHQLVTTNGGETEVLPSESALNGTASSRPTVSAFLDTNESIL